MITFGLQKTILLDNGIEANFWSHGNITFLREREIPENRVIIEMYPYKDIQAFYERKKPIANTYCMNIIGTYEIPELFNISSLNELLYDKIMNDSFFMDAIRIQGEPPPMPESNINNNENNILV